MNLSIIYELRANNIDEKDIEYIMQRVKNRISEENVDIELQKLGYPKIFTVDYDDYDNDYMDDDFSSTKNEKTNKNRDD